MEGSARNACELSCKTGDPLCQYLTDLQRSVAWRHEGLSCLASGAIADGPDDVHLKDVCLGRALHTTGDCQADPVGHFGSEGPMSRGARSCDAQEGVAYLPEDGVFTCLTVDVFP